VFRVYNDNFPLYIKHENFLKKHTVANVSASLLYKCGFYKSLYIIVHYLIDCFKLIHNLLYFNNNMHMIEICMRARNASVYGLLEP